MLVFHDDFTLRHQPEVEIHRGQVLSPFENPQRVKAVLQSLEVNENTTFRTCARFDADSLERVHAVDYLQFLKTVFTEWQSLDADGHIVPHVWPSRCMTPKVPDSLFGRLGYYSFDAGTTISAGTWDTAFASACCAMSAAETAWNERTTTFALCRPPGHHAERGRFGGYCFLNTAALAVEHFRQLGAERVAVLDVDYHHGNGTQSIFYDRPDVLTISIHADPLVAYPYFIGYEHETGHERGEGMNRNFCLPDGTDWERYRQSLDQAVQRVADFAPDALVVPFGADTYHEDPISTFQLTTEDFARMSELIARLARPCAVTLEGGYAIEALGRNVQAFLSAW